MRYQFPFTYCLRFQILFTMFDIFFLLPNNKVYYNGFNILKQGVGGKR